MRTKLSVAITVVETLLIALLLSGCGGGGESSPVPDMSPVGDGLSFIGLGLVLAAIIGLIGILIRPPK